MLTHLYTLLLVLVVAGSTWAAFGPAAALATLMVLLAFAIRATSEASRYAKVLRVAVMLLWFLALICLLLPAIEFAREAARQMQCMNNLKQIGLALQVYNSCHGRFPPTCTFDKVGHPMHSWRLLILPFIECSPIYDYYDFREPWDSAKNRRCLGDRIYAYTCPDDETAHAEGSTIASYLAVVGRAATQPSDDNSNHGNHSPPKQTDGTFLLVETTNSGIQWAEPKDIALDNIPSIEALATKGPHAHNNGYFYHETPGVNAMLVDGNVMFPLPCNVADDVLKSLANVTFVRTSADSYDLTAERQRLNWPHCIGLPVWLLSVALLFHQSYRIRKKRERVANSDS